MHTLLFLLATIIVQAEPIPPSPDCGAYCSPPMREILEDFQRAGTIETESLPVVFSGECYHLSRDYYPDHAHHGFTLLETKDEQFFMGGLFSFFAKENPYANLTIEEAREKSPRRFENSHRLTLSPGLAYADMNRENPGNPWKYWLKQNSGNLLLIGQWGIHHQLYCRFTKNP